MVSGVNCNVFVYGSLLSDDVVGALISRVPPSSPAILPHYHRFSIKGRVYPAIIPAENNKVIGKLLMDITPPELHILDLFEDNEYERTTVDVFLKDSSDKVQVQAYVWQNKKDPNLYGVESIAQGLLCEYDPRVLQKGWSNLIQKPELQPMNHIIKRKIILVSICRNVLRVIVFLNKLS